MHDNFVSMVIYIDDDGKPAINLYRKFEDNFDNKHKALLMLIAMGLTTIAQETPLTVLQVGQQVVEDNADQPPVEDKTPHLRVVH
jgi:hypothetical protein